MCEGQAICEEITCLREDIFRCLDGGVQGATITFCPLMFPLLTVVTRITCR